jgi:hypothetical protein
MIPYDDLVAALSAWRIKKGLPVAETAAAMAPPISRGAPPAPPPTPPPMFAEEALDVDEAAMLEEASYDSEGDDFAMKFGHHQQEQEHEETAIGEAPEPTDPSGFGSGKRNDGW